MSHKADLKIVCLDGYTENPGDLSWDGFKALGDFTIYDRTSGSDIIPRIGSAEAILTNKTPISRTTLEACPNLRYIGVLATGYNVVDTDAAKEQGVTVTNIPTYGTSAVGQFAIALLLEICHRIGHHSEAVRKGRWENCDDFCFWDYPLIELAGKTMGIIGFGRIGQVTGTIAKALGMKVIAYDEAKNTSGQAIGDYVSLDTIFAQSDVISLHCPLLPSTQGLINKNTIPKMKDGVIILNNSRGPLIVEQDLADALNSGKVYAAGVDVVSSEPIKADNPLLKAKNCIITPHISWASKESRKRLMDIAVGNLSAFLQGKPVNTVG
ncbi:D-2-hydroxyacid dehydrogenase [Leadbettera azotonutricia]|uniref:Glycerate dehydrogenase n=1 Tax=Leadbettera azotonutricia (strain ATCC BAA-888 / DSM 13862 / ZAS-9) TaxID=545695 RepID=F5YFD6_LEAAZ|nr:D-2-hydroxyacid dehydrogenase [Leadbettera azotonutricia]AEF82065.1 glycerate dehydrogenase [Leadbettera azotonutricia ZAS-9]